MSPQFSSSADLLHHAGWHGKPRNVSEAALRHLARTKRALSASPGRRDVQCVAST